MRWLLQGLQTLGGSVVMKSLNGGSLDKKNNFYMRVYVDGILTTAKDMAAVPTCQAEKDFCLGCQRLRVVLRLF